MELRATFGEPDLDAPLSISHVAGSFNDQVAGGLRPNHALGAARNVRRRETWSVGAPGPDPYEITVGLSDITTTRHHHSMITVVHRRPGAEPVVDTAWRLPDLLPATTSPTEAFLEFIGVTGLPVVLDGQPPTLFVVEAVTPTHGVHLVQPPTGGARIMASFRRNEDGNGWNAAWAYAIDTGRYLESL